jgi:hypothetical protein
VIALAILTNLVAGALGEIPIPHVRHRSDTEVAALSRRFVIPSRLSGELWSWDRDQVVLDDAGRGAPTGGSRLSSRAPESCSAIGIASDPSRVAIEGSRAAVDRWPYALITR